MKALWLIIGVIVAAAVLLIAAAVLISPVLIGASPT